MSEVCNAPSLMPIESALSRIEKDIHAVTQIGKCSIEASLNRVLGEDVLSTINVPGYNNSAMDGYALSYNSLVKDIPLKLVGKSFAGEPYTAKVLTGECVRIMTGAMIPAGCDTVVMQENATQVNKKIYINIKANKGSNIRLAGSDIPKGSVILKKGTRLNAIHIGLLASLGIANVTVFRKIKVAIFSTGNELTPLGEPLTEGRIYDSNRPMIRAMLESLNVEVLDYAMVRDDKDAIKEALTRADKEADCVITSGGVSVGEADFTRDVLGELGTIHFWKLAIKPGKPIAFGRLCNSFFFGLPGNPVSAVVTFEKIVVKALALLANEKLAQKPKLIGKAKTSFRKKAGRTDFQRAICTADENGILRVEPLATQSSGVLSSFVNSNCYAVLERERQNVEAGEDVEVQLF